MIAQGHVQNGVIVLDGDIRLPEGQEVTVLTQESSPVTAQPARKHSVLDIPPLNVGSILRPLGPDDDLLGEMLEGRS